MGRKRLYMGSFFDYFTVIFDLREQGKVQHKLMDVLFIAVGLGYPMIEKKVY